MKNSIAVFAAFLLLFLIVVVVDASYWSAFRELNMTAILISLVFASVIQNISGIMYYYTRKQYGVSLRLTDIFLFPSVMGLWNLILPIHGSLIFSTIFFKIKYKMNVSQSLSINVYLYMLTIAFTGLVGLMLSISHHYLCSWLGIISLLLLCNPLLLPVVDKIFKYNTVVHNGLLFKTQQFVSSIFINTKSMWSNPVFVLKMTFLKTVHLLLSIIWFYYIAAILEFDLSFLEVALISLVASATLIIKITPGNLGTTQLLTGAFMGVVGYSPEQAIMITLFASATVFILNLTVGLYGNYHYFRTFSLLGLKDDFYTQ